MPDENALVPAPQEVLDQANVQDWEGLLASAAADPVAFWEKEAGELEWSQPWDKVLDDSGAPFYKWFTGARTNIVTNAIDRHLSTARRNKLALIWVGEDTSKVRTFSYFSLNREVEQMANILLSMGVTKGDVVTIYLPRIPEIYFAMLACAKIGAIHSVVFAGYSSEALNARIDDSESRVVITVDGSWINGSVFPMKKIVDDAVRFSPTVENVIVVRNTASEVTMDPTRDHWYHELARLPIAQGHCPTVQVDAEDPLFILYTSGSTGKPKAAVHTHGGYQVHLSSTMKNCLDIHEADRWWCTADPGWITGTSYVIYAPLIRGATTFMAEGSPVYPYPDVWWQLVEHYGINGMFTAPTAIRTLMRFGDAWVTKHDLSTLRILVSAGEPLNPEAWRWFHEVVGRKRCAVIDNWWQTETGAMQITSLPAMPKKPGSAGRPIPGQAVAVLDEAGHEVPAGTDGFLVLKNPWPSMLRTLFKEPDRYLETYWTKYPGVYLTGDSARIDEDGYVWIIGRTDDVIKVSGHRIGTAEVEAAVNSHPAVAECAAIGLPHEVKGNAIHVLAVLNTGYEGSNELVGDIRQHVSQTLSPIAKPDVVEFVDKLPKTRSGKIMRRVLRARALGEDEGDLSTLENG
ncbi:acetate--CoA ligase [Acidipropionibacterium jensenii]|uniref:acetate--CoA ligase n=1 Tax=Acidipropionibacterium jensenii TaxID=1749 RepID=UPI000BC2D15A|nr:acetate--CoA ligase [Acidipropionibacterium jensenii]AZZ41890.1 acetate--CoA ligase [Acidipropionibacterium jensenii]